MDNREAVEHLTCIRERLTLDQAEFGRRRRESFESRSAYIANRETEKRAIDLAISLLMKGL